MTPAPQSVSPLTNAAARAGSATALAAAVWGFAEATLFFIVPDVWLTWLALHSRRRALWASAAALAGAIAGGSLMHGWGARDPAGAAAVLDRVPAVSPSMIDAVERSLHRHGVAAMFAGPLSGTPYKLYAMQAGAIGVGLPIFLLVSIPARALRFIGLVVLTSWLARRPAARLSDRGRRGLHLAVWTAFYVGFFFAMPR